MCHIINGIRNDLCHINGIRNDLAISSMGYVMIFAISSMGYETIFAISSMRYVTIFAISSRQQLTVPIRLWLYHFSLVTSELKLFYRRQMIQKFHARIDPSPSLPLSITREESKKERKKIHFTYWKYR